jgi:PBS lyase HEAT-like repeat
VEGDPYRTAGALLASTEPDEILRGLALVRAQISMSEESGARRLFEMVFPLFYIDPLDLPGHLPVLEEAISVVAGLGDWVIPVLIQSLESGDVKAQMAIAQALGRMGSDAIQPLIAEYEGCPEPGCGAFVLYALGKIKSPAIAAAAPVALDAAGSPDQELRDSATRAIGKFAESVPAGSFQEELRADLVVVLQRNLADPSPGIRAKAVRSLGKLAKFGHLTANERDQLGVTLKRILGEDEAFEWDRAYVVRKEAKEARQYV